MKKICLITTGHLSSDPRLVKEAACLSSNGYIVHIIFLQNLHYLIPFDQHILNKYPQWTFNVLNLANEPIKARYLSLLNKITRGSEKIVPLSFIAPFAKNKAYKWQLRKAKAANADCYIAHNLGALPVSVNAAKFLRAKCGFDAEDYHRYEVSDLEDHPDVILNRYLEDKYIPQLDYLTGSSPLIAASYSELFKLPCTCILNVFNKTNNRLYSHHTRALKLFWFSQTIGINRGIETIIKALNLTKNRFEFHLLGTVDQKYAKALTSLVNSKSRLYFHAPMMPDDIFEFATQFDIGLASEPGFSMNNNYALSNKIFTYVQAGLAVVASNTPAQKHLLDQNNDIGMLYKNNDPKHLADVLDTYYGNRPLLYQHSINAFNLGQSELNWEKESRKFMDIISSII